MKKEVVIAVIIGLTLGLIVSVGVYRARKSLQTQLTNVAVPSTTPSASDTNQGPLAMISPEDETVQSTKEVKVTGTTKPEAVVTIMVNDTPHVTTADKSGNFSIQTELQPNVNSIQITAVDEDGNVMREERTVTYTTTALEDAPTASYSATTQSAKTTKTLTPKPSPSASTTP